MKKQAYISIFFALLISLFSLKSFLVMSYYIVFTDTFIENYCVNTDKPELNCDGKCYLSELLENNSAENENQEKMMLISSSELIFYFDVSLFQWYNIEDNYSNKTSTFIPEKYTFDYFEKLIKPPKYTA